MANPLAPTEGIKVRGTCPPRCASFHPLSFSFPRARPCASSSARNSALSLPSPRLQLRIKEHYDGLSSHYKSLWGQHIHHGLWKAGQEHLSKEAAQEALVRELVAHAKLPAKPRVLDVGCGVGGTSLFLAKELGARVTGVTISTAQVGMARSAADEAGLGAAVDFHEGDGERLDELPALAGAQGTFDAVWISEALSHFVNKDRFFAHAHAFLKPGGKLVLADWFRADKLSKKHEKGVIAAIEHGMLLPRLDSMPDYYTGMSAAGLRLVWLLDVSKEVAKTWDLSIELCANPSLWAMCVTMGSDFIAFLRAFSSMREGFASGAFRYGLFVAEKPRTSEISED